MEKHYYQNQIREFEEHLSRDPQAAYRRFGVTLLNSTRNPVYFEEIRRFGWEPRTKYDYFNLGVSRNEAGDHSGAVSMYQKVLGFDAGFAPAYYNLAYSYEALGKADDQKKALERFIGLMEDKERSGRLNVQEKDELASARAALRG